MKGTITVKEHNTYSEPEQAVSAFEGGNITFSGEVLFLDEARREAKVDRSRPLRQNRPDGLGLKNWFARRMSALITAEKNGALREKGLKSLMAMAGMPDDSLRSRIVHRLVGTDEKGYTHVHVLPLNVDLSDMHGTVIVPYDLIVAELNDADFIAIMNFCICRTSMKCRHYPQDFGCIFTGAPARHLVKMGLARHASYDEAVAHVDRAAELGLMGAADFVEGEQFIWGTKNSDMNECRMICFCCECCCVAMNMLKISRRDVNGRFTPVGWTATVDHNKCTGCRACEKRCPRKCISFGPDGLRITDQNACLGCGFCKLACRFDAVSIRQTMPMRENLNEYFINEARIDDGRVHAPAVHVARKQ